MLVHSLHKRKRKDLSKGKYKTLSKHEEFLTRITKTLYYGDKPIPNQLSLPVTELAAEIFSEVKAGRSLERLRLEEAAEISRNTCASPCSFVLALVYLERLKCCNPAYVDRAVPSELFLISMMVASKFLNDDGEDDEVLNSEWAEAAGLTLREINRLEKEFLKAINWEVFIKEPAFWTHLRKLERNIALKEGKRRGWFSYTELETLLDCLDSFTLTQALITMSAVCLASYTAGILTVVGSTMLVSQIPPVYLITQSASMIHSSLDKSIFFNVGSPIERENGSVNSCSTDCTYFNKNRLNQNWDFDISTWFAEIRSNDTSEGIQLEVEESFDEQGKLKNSFLDLSNYLYLFTKNLQHRPLELISSH